MVNVKDRQIKTWLFTTYVYNRYDRVSNLICFIRWLGGKIVRINTTGDLRRGSPAVATIEFTKDRLIHERSSVSMTVTW
jgi:hypothetical protein